MSTEFPPRERGWSHSAPVALQGAVVSPARAGMVPPDALGSCSAMCFPRASGDGPLIRPPSSASGLFPPRERGWSHGKLHLVASILVSPARAGMVR